MRKKTPPATESAAAADQWAQWTQPFRDPGRRIVFNAGVMNVKSVLNAGLADATLRYSNAAALIAEGNKQRIRRKHGGEATASNAREDAKTQRAKYQAAAQKLLTNGRSAREVAGILAPRYGVSPRTIRRVLKKTDNR